MATDDRTAIRIDDLVAAATDGVFRALEARNISGTDFTRDNGFFVKFDVTCGAWPGPGGPGPGTVAGTLGGEQPRVP